MYHTSRTWMSRWSRAQQTEVIDIAFQLATHHAVLLQRSVFKQNAMSQHGPCTRSDLSEIYTPTTSQLTPRMPGSNVEYAQRPIYLLYASQQTLSADTQNAMFQLAIYTSSILLNDLRDKHSRLSQNAMLPHEFCMSSETSSTYCTSSSSQLRSRLPCFNTDDDRCTPSFKTEKPERERVR